LQDVRYLAALIIGMVAFGIIISGATAFAQVALYEVSGASEAIRAASTTLGALSRIRMTPVDVCETALGTTISFEVENTGSSPLHTFSDWDFIAWYNTSAGEQVSWLTYSDTDTPSAGEWVVAQILAPGGSAENVGRGVVDPGESAQITAEFASSVWASSGNMIRITTPGGASAEIDVSGSNPCGFYLHNSATTPTADTLSSVDLPATPFYPSQTTLYNYDTDVDAQTGIAIATGGSGPDEADTTRYQNWQTGVLSSDLELQGTISLRLFAAVENFSTSSTGSLVAYLRNFNGSTSTEIASTTLTAGPWDAGATGTFVDKTLSFSNVSYTIAQGNQLEIKVIVGASSTAAMWVAYDTISYPSNVQFPLVRDLYGHGEQSKIATSTYYDLLTSYHDSGYYLHNNPTPATGATTAQSGLGMTLTYPDNTTLWDYDSDIDSTVGRTIAKGGSGAGETDISLYQNWLSPVLAADTSIDGNVVVEIWGAAQGFSSTSSGELILYLRDFNGSTYTEIASTTISASAWDSAASGTWVKKAGEISVSNYTVSNGNQIELKITVGAGSSGGMMIAYDATLYPSVLVLPGNNEPDPQGNATILTADSGNAVARVQPTENGGRLLYPLNGYSAITDSTWDVSYRVWTGDPPYGFQYFTTATDVTPAVAGSWQDVDLSAVVPVDTTGVLVELVNGHPSNALSGVVRGKADTRDYMASGGQTLGGRGHRWQIVKVDSSRLIQAYVQDTVNVMVKVIGYTVGVDPTFELVPPDITPASTTQWTTVDLTGQVDGDTDGVILMIDNTGNATNYAVREIGSTDADTANDIDTQANVLYMVGIDAADQLEIYLGTAGIKVYMVGQTKGSVVYYANDVAVADPPTRSWQQIDATTYSVPTSANGVILRVENNQNKSNDLGLRRGDSSDDWNKAIAANTHSQGTAGLSALSQWGEYLGSANVDVSIAAYTIYNGGLVANTHADMDVLIRTQTGDVRTTLGSHVATTTDIAATGWVTKTSTFTPGEYTIIDQTDYLEIDLYAHITGNETESTVLKFMLDDKTVDLINWTHIENIALIKD